MANKPISVYKVRRNSDGYYAAPYKFCTFRWDRNGKTYLKKDKAEHLFCYLHIVRDNNHRNEKELWGNIELVECQLVVKKIITKC